ncbi:aromatic ring-hydroxylating oxygenase subunit alpha [Immundisolibacter sp.]
MNAPHRGAPVDKSSPAYLASLFDRRPDEGIYRVNRSVYTDPDLYELELARIFEGSWIFLCHESQLPGPYDYFSTWMGRRAVFVQRNGEGRIQGFLNACPHRGARLCRTERGNRKHHACTYHGWTFDADGKALWVQRAEQGYPADFSTDNVDLHRIVRVESYRGFVFGSLNADVPSLAEHLGGAAAFIDMLVDQCPDGITVLPGASICVYHGNWKLMLENGGGDGLHPDYAHKSLLGVAKRKDERSAAVRTMQIDKMHEKRGGQWTFGHGHTGIWFNFPNPQDRPIYQQRERLQTQFGAARAEWMTGVFRNLSVYPNLHLLDQMATLIRTFRPVAVDRTEITFYCLAPVAESERERSHRLRQFEEFFMASGMGTPDDNEEFEQCQQGALGADADDSYIAFGLHNRTVGDDEVARGLGIALESSGIIGYEGCTMTQYDQWLRLISAGQGSTR